MTHIRDGLIKKMKEGGIVWLAGLSGRAKKEAETLCRSGYFTKGTMGYGKGSRFIHEFEPEGVTSPTRAVSSCSDCPFLRQGKASPAATCHGTGKPTRRFENDTYTEGDPIPDTCPLRVTSIKVSLLDGTS